MTGEPAMRQCGEAAKRQCGDAGGPASVPVAEEGEVRTMPRYERGPSPVTSPPRRSFALAAALAALGALGAIPAQEAAAQAQPLVPASASAPAPAPIQAQPSLPAPVQGQPSALATALPGRLFLTPAERAHLDELRRARPQQARPPQAEEGRAETTQPGIDIPPPPPPEPFTMNGLVVRSSGPNTVWVDGQPVLSTQDTDKGVRIDTRRTNASGTPVTVLESGRAVRLKPGQTYVPEGDRMTERYEAPPAPEPR